MTQVLRRLTRSAVVRVHTIPQRHSEIQNSTNRRRTHQLFFRAMVENLERQYQSTYVKKKDNVPFPRCEVRSRSFLAALRTR